MSKRQLSNKYKDLVKYVNECKHYEDLSLSDILSEAIKEGKRNSDVDSELWNILNNLYVAVLIDSDFVDLTRAIVDIYNDNYELKEPKYYWKFKELRGLARHDLYFGITFDDEPLLVDISDGGIAEKCTKTELSNYLRDTELTADNFTTVEEIKK